MGEELNIQRLLQLRKVTRAMAEALRGQLKEYLSSLAPLIRPKLFFGDFVGGPGKEQPNFADKTFQELVSLYQSFALGKPFQAPKDVKSPMDIVSAPLEITPLEYTHEAKSDHDSKVIAITSPLKWVVSYPEVSPPRLRELLMQKSPPVDVLQRYCLHYAVLSYVMKKPTGFGRLLEALRFSVSSFQLPEFGLLPIPIISSPVSTVRPSDNVLIENTEISGTNNFEEVVNLDDVAGLHDPLRDQLVGIVRNISPGLLAE